jgi:two-component system response regulator AtoC
MGAGKRILVVDDEEHVLFTLLHTLARLGDEHEIVTSSSGQDALVQAAGGPFDLLLTDLRMPEVDGVALTEAIRVRQPSVIVIWMTAYGGPAVSAEAERLGVYRCLDKPIEVSEIRRIVRQALEAGNGGGL